MFVYQFLYLFTSFFVCLPVSLFVEGSIIRSEMP